jgi:hypothetical protein
MVHPTRVFNYYLYLPMENTKLDRDLINKIRPCLEHPTGLLLNLRKNLIKLLKNPPNLPPDKLIISLVQWNREILEIDREIAQRN